MKYCWGVGVTRNGKGKNLERKRGEGWPKGKEWGCCEGLRRRMGWQEWKRKKPRGRGGGRGGLRRRKGNGKDGGSCGSMNKEGVGGTTEAGWMGEENRSIHPKPVGSFGSLV